MGVNLRFIPGSVNKVAASAMTLADCDGSDLANWPSVNTLVDGTKNGGISCNQSGVITWDPVEAGTEFTASFAGGPSMYYYRVQFAATLTASNVKLYYVTGIPAPTQMRPYKFPFQFLNRPMLCGSLVGNEGHRVDYAMTNAPDAWNGPDGSFGVDNEPLYFGSGGELTAACEVYNRLGSSIYSFAIFCKAYETYILNGYDPESFRIYPVSSSMGCPAPLTMDTYQIGISQDAASVRSIAMWLSHAGPVMFDSGGLTPVPGVECYFDPNDSRCINFAAVETARGWFDPDQAEYNLLIPSGSAQTACNIWLVYSIEHKKWFRKVPSAAASPYPQLAFRVEDTNGKRYLYGCRDNGYLMRLENGATWDGTGSVQSITPGDMVPSQDIWDQVRLRQLKLFGISITEDIDCAITYYADGASAGTALTAVEMNGSNRHFRSTQLLNLLAWSHMLKFSTTVSTETRGMRLLGWAIEFQVEREDR
jgi:hypothetical protein